MTKEQLEQLIRLRQEIEQLKGDIARLKARNKEIISDKVQASGREWPYLQGSRIITGYDQQGNSRRRATIIRKQFLLEERKEAAENLEREITEFINSIPDAETRIIFHARYDRGLTWEQIGRELHCDRSTAEKKASKYLRENSE